MHVRAIDLSFGQSIVIRSRLSSTDVFLVDFGQQPPSWIFALEEIISIFERTVCGMIERDSFSHPLHVFSLQYRAFLYREIKHCMINNCLKYSFLNCEMDLVWFLILLKFEFSFQIVIAFC